MVAIEANEPLPLMTYSFLDKDPDFAIKLITHPMPSCDIKAEQPVMRRRLNGRSKGLLEVETAAQGETSSLQKVSFLHRTVRDFFQIKDINNMLKDMAPIKFDPNSALGRAHMAELMSGLSLDPQVTIDRIVCLAEKSAKKSGLLDFVLIDELEISGKMQLHIFLVPATAFLEHLITYDPGISWYVENRLDREPELATPRLLNAALAVFWKDLARTPIMKPQVLPSSCDGPWKSWQGWMPDIAMIHMLVGRGINPNGIDSVFSTWQEWMKAFEACLNEQTAWSDTAKLLLAHGASVD